MAIGTAGFTSILSIIAIEQLGVKPGVHEVIVTGAAGGVGSVAVAVLAKLGYQVAASTGRAELSDYLKSLGATSIVERAALEKPSGRPLDAERWAGGIDSVGETLASVGYGHALRRCRGGLWSCWGSEPADSGVSVYSARSQFARHRFSHVPKTAANRRLATSCT